MSFRIKRRLTMQIKPKSNVIMQKCPASVSVGANRFHKNPANLLVFANKTPALHHLVLDGVCICQKIIYLCPLS